ncbi:hypothetical protein B0T19DRAFT_401968 [Cercophora scortea]|uniref:Uncharacterized protein n=1 Tax=Cercophora scortea TaxID=314031 RepID=A0AAE0M9N9_9PEZI|nr:hypothetical protein B0T19DRAFT_401968 [Cercophora scortea]
MPVMWDRLRTTGPRQQFDHDKMMSSATKGYSYTIKGGPAPPRPPREFLEREFDYETAPAVQEPPPRNPRRLALRTSTFRQPSSVYSGHEPPVVNRPVAKLASRQAHRYGGGEEISPPSSPEPDELVVADQHGDVSPIDEELPNLAQLAVASSRNPRADQRNVKQYQESPQRHLEGNIPMMRRARRNEALASHPPPQNTRQQEPRWDPLTGERTSSPHGHPSQVKPAEFAHGLGITTHISSSAAQKTPPVTTSSFGDRVRRMAKKAGGKENRDPDPAAGAFTSSRPGWRGASGRTTIVDPVRDDPQVAPLRIPDKTRRIISQTSAPVSAPKPHLSLAASRRGQTPPVSPPPGSETHAGSEPGLRDTTAAKVVPLSQLSPAATKPYTQGSHGIPSSPLSPNLPGGDAPSVAARELARSGLANRSGFPPSSPASPSFSNSPRESPNAIRRKPPPAHANRDHQHQESVSSVYSQQPEAPPAPPPHMVNDPWVQPASRFSITTYATSAAATPRESLDDFDHSQHPMPALSRELTENTPGDTFANQYPMSLPFNNNNNESQASRDRKAAITGGGAQQTPAAAAAGVNPNLARMRNMSAAERRISTASSINKVLPLAPPETTAEEARDRVGMLNAQLVSLGNRRININRSIKQMTELMPTDNLMDSGDVIRKRELERQKVEALKKELSEVQREEYELGLKLHRAYKRLDKNADFEPTTLWVRRVTN